MGFIPQNVKKIQNLHPNPHFKTYKIMPIKYAIVETRNNLHATVVRLQLILFSKDIGAF
jgi:hypothetical protein